jgi:hypothetical protein
MACRGSGVRVPSAPPTSVGESDRTQGRNSSSNDGEFLAFRRVCARAALLTEHYPDFGTHPEIRVWILGWEQTSGRRPPLPAGRRRLRAGGAACACSVDDAPAGALGRGDRARLSVPWGNYRVTARASGSVARVRQQSGWSVPAMSRACSMRAVMGSLLAARAAEFRAERERADEPGRSGAATPAPGRRSPRPRRDRCRERRARRAPRPSGARTTTTPRVVARACRPVHRGVVLCHGRHGAADTAGDGRVRDPRRARLAVGARMLTCTPSGFSGRCFFASRADHAPLRGRSRGRPSL